jgi:hypothetical protein
MGNNQLVLQQMRVFHPRRALGRALSGRKAVRSC